jgi:photosystem II stability/assembly factor-like uncharacterized protein
LLGAGFVLVFTAILWLVFSNRQSEDSGARPISHLTTADFHSLAFSLTEPDTVYFGHHHGLLVSHNGGRDWESSALHDVDAMALALPSSDPRIMYAAGHDVFFKSLDGGESWASVVTNLPGLDLHGFAVDPENAGHVYAHVVGYGIFGSQDGGSTWTQLSDAVPSSTFNLAVGADPQTLYAAAAQAGLLRSTDGGHTWATLNEIPDQGAIAVAYARASGDLYVSTLGAQAGLYVSGDDGQSWTFAGLKGTFLAIAVSPIEPTHLIVVDKNGDVFASRDSGLSWTDK